MQLLKNRWVLYFVFILALLQLYSFAVSNEGLYAAIFILVGYLSSFFSKNMIVILCLALTVSSLIKYGSRASIGSAEGFENASETEDITMSGSKQLDEPTISENSVLSAASSVNSPSSGGSNDPALSISSTSNTKAVTTKQSSGPSAAAAVKPTSSDSISEVKQKLDKMANNLEGKPATDEQKMQFKKLIELQAKLIDGVSGITPLLTEARAILKDLGQ